MGVKVCARFLHISYLPIILENTRVGYADDLTLLAEVPKPGNRVSAL